ncbi:MAG TPA: glycosyltransferase family 2 protein [Candidatus Limnocylindrales bacterium]|nr:glycosyltransferase family 2 protein [Candidatus Limnocylindrales bacterium]
MHTGSIPDITPAVKVVIQIPCFNEEAVLAETMADLPRTLTGVDEIAVVVVDDGSTDGTSEVARRCGADHVLRVPVNQGLARAFSSGLDFALKLGADIIVNTDADHQYRGDQIQRLIDPILHHEADIVVGNRRPGRLAHFSPLKRLLQVIGSWVVSRLSGLHIPDATSGFRAFSREAALRMNVVSDFTYTLETVIQAGKKQLFVAHVDIDANPQKRPSRLFPGIPSYILRSISTLVRIYALYEPMRVFTIIGLLLLSGGGAIGLRFMWYFFTEGGGGHIQSLVLAAVLLLAGFQTILIGLMADLMGSSRRILEDSLLRIRRLELREYPRPEPITAVDPLPQAGPPAGRQ